MTKSILRRKGFTSLLLSWHSPLKEVKAATWDRNRSKRKPSRSGMYWLVQPSFLHSPDPLPGTGTTHHALGSLHPSSVNKMPHSHAAWSILLGSFFRSCFFLPRWPNSVSSWKKSKPAQCRSYFAGQQLWRVTRRPRASNVKYRGKKPWKLRTPRFLCLNLKKKKTEKIGRKVTASRHTKLKINMIEGLGKGIWTLLPHPLPRVLQF